MPAHQEGIDLLRENADFCRYVVSSALQKVEQMREKGQCDGPQGTHRERLYQHLSTIARYRRPRLNSLCGEICQCERCVWMIKAKV